MSNKHTNVGFVSTRFAGTDGVTLETQKWEKVLNEMGYECFFFSGESDWPDDRCYLVPEAHFKHPEIHSINRDLFDDYERSSETSEKIQEFRRMLKEHLFKFKDRYQIDLLIVENALSIPMNIPLGLAITELVAETRVPTLAHHHDFAWERSRFKVSAASDYQLGAFPPVLPAINHVVINSYASKQLALRTGSSSTVIPNVMDFEEPPPEPDDYADDLRSELGLGEGERLLLQPTRVVPRKRIEFAIELTRRLGNCTLVISHASGDEGMEYQDYLQEYAELMGVHTIFAGDRISYERGMTEDGKKIYSLADIYLKADLVTYPSIVEGFGNAFLETIYFRRPIVISTYDIFRTDIQPKGFEVIGFEDFISNATVKSARDILNDTERTRKMVDHNYDLGRRYFSYRVLEEKLRSVLTESLGLD